MTEEPHLIAEDLENAILEAHRRSQERIRERVARALEAWPQITSDTVEIPVVRTRQEP